jgi:hypothetical protein
MTSFNPFSFNHERYTYSIVVNGERIGELCFAKALTQELKDMVANAVRHATEPDDNVCIEIQEDTNPKPERFINLYERYMGKGVHEYERVT